MTTSFLLNPARAPKLNEAGYPIKKKYSLYVRLGNTVRPSSETEPKQFYMSGKHVKKDGWQDLSINPTVMAKIQADIASGALDTSKPVSVLGEYFNRKGKTQGFQVVSMRNALSDVEFAAQNAARREARAAG